MLIFVIFAEIKNASSQNRTKHAILRGTTYVYTVIVRVHSDPYNGGNRLSLLLANGVLYFMGSPVKQTADRLPRFRFKKATPEGNSLCSI